MIRPGISLTITLAIGGIAYGLQKPDERLEIFRLRMKAELERLPDYVCTQTIERFSRPNSERARQKIDTLRFDVALIGDQELYGPPGARQFHNRPLADVVGRGTVSTGRLGLLARQVFGGSTARFAYRAEGEMDGRRVHSYDYEVPPERSSYVLRSGAGESPVGFQGGFWIDAESLDLIRLEVQAYDIPEQLGLAEANTALTYSREVIETGILLPVSATLSIATVDGAESLNRTQLSACRQYRAESTLRFEGETAPLGAGDVRVPNSRESLFPADALFELALDSDLNPVSASIGDPITARLTRPFKNGGRITAPEGALVRGHLVRVEKQSMPFLMFEIGLEFSSVEVGNDKFPVVATMEEAGPAAGLLKQTKRLDPVFTKRRTARMDILVREVQRGQGILHWDARRGSIPQGFRMKWRVQKDMNAR